MQEKHNIPRVVYFDTNALRQLSIGVSNVDFIQLRDLLKDLGAGLFAPDVVVREWIFQRKREVSQQMEILNTACTRLGRLLEREPLNCEQPSEVHSTIDRIMREYLDSAGIGVAPMPSLSLDSIVEMAIEKEPPFEEKKEKGFRDAVIMFTIVEHMRSGRVLNAMLVTGDAIFTHPRVADRFNANGRSVVIAKNLVDAKDKIRGQVDTLVKQIIENKKQMVTTFLNQNFDDISKYVLQNARVSNRFLLGWESIGSVEAIIGVRPTGISNVSFGHTRREKNLPEGTEPITFSVCTEFELLVKEFNPWPYFKGPEFQLSGAEGAEKREFQSREPISERRIVSRDITIEAIVSEKDGKYSGLKMKRVATY